MGNFFGSIWWLVVTLGLLVTFHEFGHFIVARKLGVKVLRFSVGFGRALWRRVGRDGTEYVIAAIPLGGYVKMLDEREGEVDPAEAHLSFNRKSVGKRFAIVAAGPVFNLVFAVAAFWAMFVVGKPDYQPLVGRVDGIALASGFERGDRIVGIAGEPVATWTDATLYLAKAAIDRVPTPVEVVDARGSSRTRTLELSQMAVAADDIGLRALGFVPKQFLIEPVLGEVRPGKPADRAGLRTGDRLVSIDGKPILDWADVPNALKALEGRPAEIVFERGGERRSASARPEKIVLEDGSEITGIGIGPRAVTAEYDAVLRYGPIAAVPAAFGETWRMTRETLALLKRMVLGQASLKNISGPISIAQFANASAQLGVAWFMFFLAVLSLSIAIMNLLPIPILDGGHLLYYLIEAVKGSPVSEKVMAAGQYVGLAMLAGLMGLAFYNDILRLIS
ncbi:MAG TPA: RIP metalloprotease RseP [Xanthomonadales bacterium]|nr:RIP metalloprotease RseP [Xanthomonadales bacterium]